MLPRTAPPLVEDATLRKFCCNLSQGPLAAFGPLTAQLMDQGDKLRTEFGVAFPALNLLAGERSLAIPAALELGDNHRLVELTHSMSADGGQCGSRRQAA